MAVGMTGGKRPPAVTGQGRQATARFAIPLDPKSALTAEATPQPPLDVHSMTWLRVIGLSEQGLALNC